MATVGWVDLFTRWELKHVIVDWLRYYQKRKRFGDPCMVPDAKLPAHDREHETRKAFGYHA